MLQSQLFTKTRKEAPKDEVAKNAELLIRAGFIHKEMAGVYTMLPLGLRVIKKIENIIRKEMNSIGGMEMQTSVLQNKEVWEKTNRWDDKVVDVWFKTELQNGGDIGLSFTNEEAYSNILKQYVNSYKDLPIYPYDFKEIFRNEARSKSGILRGREFYWKALYSFSRNEAEHLEFYNKAMEAYKNIFKHVGIGDQTYLAFASGGSFSKFSHEFQTICDAGEDLIYISKEKNIAVNKEVLNDEVLTDLGLKREELVEEKAIEVGNIFTLGTKFSAPFDLKYKTETGEDQLVFMGSYGIGISRLMGVIVEKFFDDKGLVWPKEVAPFGVHVIEIASPENQAVKDYGKKIKENLEAEGIEVLYDDRDLRPGEKFADSDLIGIPYRVVISDKTLQENKIEVKVRQSGEVKMVSESELLDLVK